MCCPFRLRGLLLASLALSSSVLAQSPQERYDRAYRLENEDRAYEEALELYREVADSRGAGDELRQRAHARAHAVAEELASADFAQLMPADAFLYVEVNRPGEELASLLDQLGLLGTWRDAVDRGAESFAISPDLIHGLLGVRGAAVAVNRVPIGDGPPGGVFVLHVGDMDVVRGMIDTALPAGGQPEEPIEGHPTWSVDGHLLVTLTSRLVVISGDREEIAGVLRRVRGDRRDSLASDERMRTNLGLRRDDLLYACVNAAPLRPLMSAALGQLASGDPGAAAAAAALDVESLEALVLRAGADPDGLSMDVVLRLSEGHRNLAFNLLRAAPLDRASLETVPAGAAGFVSWSTNPRGPRIAELEENADGLPVVTAMDFGRELFANLVGVTLFALPPEGAGGSPIPQVAASITVNDPQRSQAVWSLLLGMASVAGGAPASPGGAPETTEIAGHTAQRFHVGAGFPLYLVTLGDGLVLSPSRPAIERTLATRSRGRSILDDPGFAPGLAQLDESTTWAAMIHAGRVARIAEPWMPPEAHELGSLPELLEHTFVSAVGRHSGTEMGMSIAVRGLPKVGALIGRKMREEKERGRAYAVAYGDDHERALRAAERLLAEKGADADLLRRKFELLAGRGDDKAARDVGRELLASGADARALNNLAWALLTEERYGERFDRLALELSRRSNEMSGHATWQYLDTLALACFKNGQVEKAVELEAKALELVGDDPGRQELESALVRFRAALAEVASEGSRIR